MLAARIVLGLGGVESARLLSALAINVVLVYFG